MSEVSTKPPGWRRAVQIGLGVLAIVLAIYAIVYPGITLVTLVWILAIIFLIVGIEMVISGIFVPGRSRWGSIGLGILALILSILIMASPFFGAVLACLIIGIILIIIGIQMISAGIAGRETSLRPPGLKR